MTAVSNNSRPTPKSSTATSLIRHQDELWRYARYLGAESHEADDLVQEAFLSVHKRPFEHRGDRETAAYLRKVLRNCLLQKRKRQGREGTTVGLEMAEQVWAENDAGTGWNSQLTALKECVETLPERSQRVVTLFYQEGQKLGQIAERFDLSAEGIKTLLRRTRTNLRACIRRKVGF